MKKQKYLDEYLFYVIFTCHRMQLFSRNAYNLEDYFLKHTS
jgi:hypothetical protein